MIDFTIKEEFPKSEIEFDQRFINADACYDYLAQNRWPNGFICDKCGHDAYWISAKYIYICTKCEHQYSLTAGTIMHGTKKPITYWFKAMWWFTTRKSGVSAVNLQELLGLGSYNTAWAWLQKLRRCTVRKDREKLSQRVEVDEFVIGGKKSGKCENYGENYGTLLTRSTYNSNKLNWSTTSPFLLKIGGLMGGRNLS